VPGSTDAADTRFDAASVARLAMTVDGPISPAPGARTVLDVRGRSTVAVDGDADYVADTLAAGGRVVRLDTTAVPGSDLRSEVAAAAEASGPFVVLADAVGAHSAQRDVIEQLGAVRPGAVVVNVGMPSGRLPLATVHTRAASRLAAETASALLDAGASREAVVTAVTPDGVRREATA